jgi:VRR-NUC domain
VKRYHAPKRFKLRATDPAEVEFHRSVAELLDWILLPPTVWTTFPAGWGDLPIATAGRLKGCGLKAGMPDILVWRHDGRSIGLELKKVGKSASAKQREMHARLLGVGVRVYICETLEEVLQALAIFEVPLRSMHLDGEANGDQNAEARVAEEFA